MSSWQQFLKTRTQSNIDDLVELLRIPSVSTSEASAPEVRRAADWVSARMIKAGIENVEIMPTGPHAAVYGDWLHAPGKPTVLIYGHFDVQPADPLELWESPPFDPVIGNGRIIARGAADMKGNLLLCLLAAEAILTCEGALPVNVKYLFEGQEEIGSRDLGPLVAANRERLACDLVFTPDSLQWGEEQPVICLGTKGLCALQVDVETAAMDLHSGLYGGAVPNAAQALVALLSTLRNDKGAILVDGFYDLVAPLSTEERDAMAEVPFNAKAYQTAIGVDALVGEPGYTTYERAWARPTLEINGIWGGYVGDGVKTIVPAKAHAKITCRLVANQEPERVLDCLESHIRRQKIEGARIFVTRQQGKARPYLMARDNFGIECAAQVLSEQYGRDPYYVRMGGTLPIMDMFLQELGTYTVAVGFGQDDERVHSPNEFFRLADYERGQLIYGKLLERLGQVARKAAR